MNTSIKGCVFFMSKKKEDNKILAVTLGGVILLNLFRPKEQKTEDQEEIFQNWDSNLYFGPENYDQFYDLNKNQYYIESKLTNDSINSSANMNWRVDLNSFFIGIDGDKLINPLTHSKWKGNKSIYYYRINCPIEIFNPFDIEHFINLFFSVQQDSNPIIYNNNELIPWDSRAFIEFLFTCYCGYLGTKDEVDNFVSSIESATKYIDDEKSFNSTEEHRFPPQFGRNSYSDLWDYAVDYVRDKYSTTKDNARVALLATKGIFLLEAVISNLNYKTVLKEWAWDRLSKKKYSLVWGSTSTDAISIKEKRSIIVELINGADLKFISLNSPFSEIDRGLAPNLEIYIKYYSDQINSQNFKNFIISYGTSLNLLTDYSNNYVDLELKPLERFTYLDNTQYFDRFLQMMSEYHENFGEQQAVGYYEQKQ